MLTHSKRRMVFVLAMIVVFTLGFPLGKVSSSVKEPITLYWPYEATTMPNLDPQAASDEFSHELLQNLYVGLTDRDPKTGQIRPAGASSWEQNQDGTVWTFTINNNIPWVKWDSAAQTVQKIRNLSAQDFAYGFKRACDPSIPSYYGDIIATIIKGCRSDYPDQLAVKALDETKLEVTTTHAFPVFLSMTVWSVFYALPQEMVEQAGDGWLDPKNIVSDGPFVLDSLSKSGGVLLKNGYYPKDVNSDYGGNVERVVLVTGQSLYSQNKVDITFVESNTYKTMSQDAQLKKELIAIDQPSVTYFGFIYRAPFDDVQVRRAFSAIIDRKANFGSIGTPMAHFTPPGLIGAVPIDKVGVGTSENLGFDPDYAKQQFAAAGYDGCKNFPHVNIVTYAQILGDILQESAEKHLGCAADKFSIKVVDFNTIAYSIPLGTNVYSMGWSADYLDAQNFLQDVLSCHAANPFRRPCSEVDDQMISASVEFDAKKRAAAYGEIEDAFFGKNGEFPIIPLFMPHTYVAVKSWCKAFVTTDLIYIVHWNTFTIDQSSQLQAREVKN